MRYALVWTLIKFSLQAFRQILTGVGQWSGQGRGATAEDGEKQGHSGDNKQTLVLSADRYDEKWEGREAELLLQSDNKYFAKK